MEEQIRALLRSNVAVASHVAQRVNFGAHPQGQPLPAIVLNTVSDLEGVTLSGPSGLSAGRIQVDCYALQYGAAKLLSRAVKKALNGYSGDGIQGVFHAGSRDSREGGTNEADRPYRVSLDFTLTYSN
tara:strand:+ start:2542 stop:2925 length:384 start_codon:yes stop_codon:yes gene_type:complete